ncbi:MAG: TadG family pilus assembly protein [Pseudomonas sp.]
MSPLNSFVGGRGRQRGAIGLMAALTLSLAVLCMLVVLDSGRLFLEKRSLQRVADMAALEAASRKGTCLTGNTAVTYANQSATRNGFTVGDDGRTLATHCGSLTLDANSRRVFTANSNSTEAIRVVASHSVPRSIAAGIGALFDGGTPLNIALSATAVAKGPPILPPLARLTIKSTLASVSMDKSTVLNQLWGGLLGGTLNISVAGWNGLLGTDIDLFKYLDQLAIDTNIKAGDYTALLASNITITQLLNSSLKVLPQNASAVQLAITNLLTANAIASGSKIKLQDLLSLQTGNATSGLNVNLNLFQLVQGFVQLANSTSAAFASIPISVPGVLSVTAKVKVVEPPQLSAVGDPALATNNPKDPNQIYVRTASVRTLISIDLSSLDGLLSGLSGTVSGLLGPLTGLDIKVAPLGLSLDLSLEAASADSHVIPGSTCASDATKTLNVETSTAAVKVKLGKLTPASASAWNSSTASVDMQELPLIDIGTVTCPFLQPCQPRVAYGGGGLGLYIGGTGAADGSIAYSKQNYVFPQPAEIQLPPNAYHTFSSQNIVTSLGSTLSGIKIVNHPPVTPGLINLITGTITTAISQLGSLVSNLLGPLLDPILNVLLQSLGISLAEVNVGANLSCHPTQNGPVAELVI